MARDKTSEWLLASSRRALIVRQMSWRVRFRDCVLVVVFISSPLALGASAVGIGRPYAWGLGAFGQAGVERVAQILDLELRLAMAGCGARSMREISSVSIIDRGPSAIAAQAPG